MKLGQTKRAATAEHELVGDVAKDRERAPIAILGALGDVADQPPLVALSVATIAAGAVLRRRDVARTGIRMLIAHALATGAKTILKSSVDRARPAKALIDGRPRADRGNGSSSTDLNSFPSGHTAGAVAIAEAIAHEVPSWGVTARLGATAIALIQLPRGRHYPSDVAVGAVLGWAADRVAGSLVATGERTIERLAEQHGEQSALAEPEAHPS